MIMASITGTICGRCVHARNAGEARNNRSGDPIFGPPLSQYLDIMAWVLASVSMLLWLDVLPLLVCWSARVWQMVPVFWMAGVLVPLSSVLVFLLMLPLPELG